MTLQPCATIHYSLFLLHHLSGLLTSLFFPSTASHEVGLSCFPLGLLSVCVTHGIQGGWLEVTPNTNSVKMSTAQTTQVTCTWHTWCQARAGIKAPCFAMLHKLHSLFLSVLVFFDLILKIGVCSVCCCVNIKYIFIVFQTFIHIYKYYIYKMSTHGHMYSRYFKELFIKKNKC